jgi:L-seryl-tRNA(Ser) seleniumtransferase
MISQPYKSLAKKAERLLKRVGKLKTANFSLELVDGYSRPGGGALPLSELPSRLLCLVPGKLSCLYMETWLRSYDPPVIGRVEKEAVLLDVRTIQAKELKVVADAIQKLAQIDLK